MGSVVPMSEMEIKREIDVLIEEFGTNPLGFFWILHDSPNENVDFATQNKKFAIIKSDTWHSLDLAEYQLWAISDNGDLLWWNGNQVIAMAPRDREFSSAHIRPSQFIRLLKSGKTFALFPDDLINGGT
jgi:hypothetical protein